MGISLLLELQYNCKLPKTLDYYSSSCVYKLCGSLQIIAGRLRLSSLHMPGFNMINIRSFPAVDSAGVPGHLET